MIKVQELKAIGANSVNEINLLLRQLAHEITSYRPVDTKGLKTIVDDPRTVIVVALDGKKIVGTGLLLLARKLKGHYAYIEDMMVDENYRGQGIGKAIAHKLIEIARKKKVRTIELSTRPSRVAANALYQKLGFVAKETNVYQLKL